MATPQHSPISMPRNRQHRNVPSKGIKSIPANILLLCQVILLLSDQRSEDDIDRWMNALGEYVISLQYRRKSEKARTLFAKPIWVCFYLTTAKQNGAYDFGRCMYMYILTNEVLLKLLDRPLIIDYNYITFNTAPAREIIIMNLKINFASFVFHLP